MEALLDNDLVRKLARYDLLDHFQAALQSDGFTTPYRRLASAPFALRTTPAAKVKPDRWPLPAQARAARRFLFDRCAAVPTVDDATLVRLNVRDFDAGEVQLVAYALAHPDSLLYTGDRRAIVAVCEHPALADVKVGMRERFVHLNSVMYALGARLGWTEVSTLVMAAPDVDVFLTNAFSQRTEAAIARTITSKIAAMRTEAPEMLKPGPP